LVAIKKIEDLTSKVNLWISKLKEANTKRVSPSEFCQNPWNPRCESPDIELYIVYEGRTIPICRSCWRKIAKTDLEW